MEAIACFKSHGLSHPKTRSGAVMFMNEENGDQRRAEIRRVGRSKIKKLHIAAIESDLKAVLCRVALALTAISVDKLKEHQS
jgi:hypothetical protein